ncbi:prostatic acid phosphatase-like [Branchiostoma floridae]|uniref:Prostatic acid phosphatase-like n=1 Tax=Branchiostoma floridae TaxID=7739 RepID=A0A9J7L2Q5_BRAFL|nr:prostatic acid phosphatase-like [Branchiostoma floridae]
MADSRATSRVVYILLVNLLLCLHIRGKRTLKFVSLLYRHGDRTPYDVYGNDTNTEDTWPQGFMQLTRVGIQQQYELGQFLRSRYVGPDFLNSSYSRYQVQVWSTDTDRTRMSAQANLAGFFPPSGNQVWNPDILWQPIPVHTKPENEDSLLGMPPCPRFDYLKQEYQRTNQEYLQMDQDNKEFFKYLTLRTGLPGDKGHWGLRKLQDSLFCEKTHNRTHPVWATPEVYDKLTEFRNFDLRADFSDRERNRLHGGPLLGAIVYNMTQAIEGTLPDGRLKLVMYSAHDATVASLLSALGTFNYIHPPYCACVMVELHQEDSGEFFVEVWYRSDSGHDPYLLTVPGCPDPCSYQQFLNATKDSIVTDREKECQLRIVDMLTRRTSIIVVGVVLVIILFVVVVIWICVRRSRRSHQHSHNLISEENISLTSTNDDDNEDETA